MKEMNAMDIRKAEAADTALIKELPSLPLREKIFLSQAKKYRKKA